MRKGEVMTGILFIVTRRITLRKEVVANTYDEAKGIAEEDGRDWTHTETTVVERADSESRFYPTH